MVQLSFSLDRADHKYKAGDAINLDVRVQVNSETKYRSIYTRIYGYAHVSWTESRQVKRNGKSHTEYTTYTSNETLFKKYQTLAGTLEGSEIYLPVGSHVYHASFRLPKELPENHENGYGHIRYEAKVHMDIPWDFDEKEKTSFQVIPCFDLNEFPHLYEPVRAAADKTFGWFCCESDPLHLYNVLPHSGYVPGDQVPFSLELNNDSDVPIDGATVKLVEKIVYHAYHPRSRTRMKERTLWRHEFSGNRRQLVAAMQNKVFSTDLHFNPSWDFHFFNGCEIITVEYYLKSEARVSGCHSNLSNCTWITMGTIPFENSGAILPPMVPMMPFPSAPADFPLATGDFPSAPPAEPISEQPLPSYDDTQSKPMAFTPKAPGIGWEGSDSLETPPPTFTEVEFGDKKEKQ